MKNDDYVIQTSSLIKKFGNFTAVNNLSLNIQKGEIYGLLGPNGAGKTTTIRILCGLVNPVRRILCSGQKKSKQRFTTYIGYMPQETALYEGLSVKQNMEFYGKIFGLKNRKIKERIDELLTFMNLKDWKDKLVGNLSGGMKHGFHSHVR